MTSKKNNQPTTTTVQQTASGPPAWATPYYQDLLNRSVDLSHRQYTPYEGQRQAGFSADQVTAQQMTRDNSFANSQATDAARGQLMGAVAGHENPYAHYTENPYLAQVIQSNADETTRNYNNTVAPNLFGQFASSGAFGGSAHQEAAANAQHELANSLASQSGQMRFNDYNNNADRAYNYGQSDMGRQLQASLAIPGFNQATYGDADRLNQSGQTQQDLWQSLLNNDYGDWQTAQGWDQNNLGILGNALNTIGGTYQTGTNSQTGANPNYISGGQQAAGYAALLASLFGKG